DLTRNLFGQLPGINMVIYGSVLVLMIMFAPRGLSGAGRSVRALWKGKAK
ncbi:MAG: branched-chain amino acid ABC transporter permease, partial [Lacisediminimonas sp.]|nr:branched-chain amino acid ABC transporter permease [Lacisediminimonas sp.]